jgi:membrane fusion protein, multidrug efflux system
MMIRKLGNRRGWIAPVVLLGTVAATAGILASWKTASQRRAEEAAAHQPEPTESVTIAVAREREHRAMTTSIGTVLALRSITLRNEVAGVVRHARLTPGQVVAAGAVLVALDVSVEEAELRALEAQSELARTTLERLERLGELRAASQEEVDQARAELEVARAQIARIGAIIERKTIRAPFRARIGLSDVHVGQYLNEGTQLTTLQGVADAVHVDFAVSQSVAAGLREGQPVAIVVDDATSYTATIVAVDARVDPTTRNAVVRARIAGGGSVPAPGASVRVEVPVGPLRTAVAVPASALRRGPSGDHVFVIAENPQGQTRAQLRPVHVGPMTADEVILLDGLAAGEQVAAAGSFKLREGALVAVAGTPLASGGGVR